jgi:hypothetical protein
MVRILKPDALLHMITSSVGVSFKWYGFYDARFPFAISTASYSIDGATPVNFTLNGVIAQQPSVQYSQVFFTTDTVSPGNHKVEVTYNGNVNTTPLTVQVIIVQNGTIFGKSSTVNRSCRLPRYIYFRDLRWRCVHKHNFGWRNIADRIQYICWRSEWFNFWRKFYSYGIDFWRNNGRWINI